MAYQPAQAAGFITGHSGQQAERTNDCCRGVSLKWREARREGAVVCDAPRVLWPTRRCRGRRQAGGWRTSCVPWWVCVRYVSGAACNATRAENVRSENVGGNALKFRHEKLGRPDHTSLYLTVYDSSNENLSVSH